MNIGSHATVGGVNCDVDFCYGSALGLRPKALGLRPKALSLRLRALGSRPKAFGLRPKVRCAILEAFCRILSDLKLRKEMQNYVRRRKIT